ncbi:hypothetical protein [Treponema primitia]|uniref:hypothetical protein n=1 Tax=Treponema primitia TaxID=88058 RepID=UPI0003184DF0|nr:hypothetical protein [Treponema primitia]
MASVRLPVEIEQKLAAVSKIRNRPKSDLIREALEFFSPGRKTKKILMKSGRPILVNSAVKTAGYQVITKKF